MDTELALEPASESDSARPTWHDATATQQQTVQPDRPPEPPAPATPDQPVAQPTAHPVAQAAPDVAEPRQTTERAPASLGSIAIIEPLLLLVAVLSAVGMVLGLYFLLAGFDNFAESERASLQRDRQALQTQVGELRSAELPAEFDVSPVETVVNAQAEPVAANPQQSDTAMPVSVDSVIADVPAAEKEPVELTDNASANDELAAELNALKAQLALQNNRIDKLVDENSRLRNAQPAALESSASHSVKKAAETKDKVAVADPPAAATPQVTISEQSAKSTTHIDGEQTGVGARSIDDEAIEVSDRLRLLLRQGFAAYQQGDYTAAGSFYDQAMLLDPYNRDANLAVASVARQLGEFRRAENRYRHLLSLDGQDSAAFSGMLDIAAALADQTIEHEMVAHIGSVEQPGRMHAALGNYYSAQRSWQLARDAWRDALAIDVSNPDYAFNLAVSLDHLQRHNTAIGYYQQALEHASTRTFHFDRATTQNRLDTLVAARNR
jgi:tetratricopeptide (TPR) repeat protein